jgi:hypothetical protein
MSAETKRAKASKPRRKLKLPRGFEVIGHTKKAVLRVGKLWDEILKRDGVGASAATPRRRRHRGKRSPLDRLPDKVKGELRRRCKEDQIFRVIRDWLKADHGFSTSITSLSDWWIRQREISRNAAQHAPLAPLEFVVHAPGARFIRVLVKSR